MKKLILFCFIIASCSSSKTLLKEHIGVFKDESNNFKLSLTLKEDNTFKIEFYGEMQHLESTGKFALKNYNTLIFNSNKKPSVDNSKIIESQLDSIKTFKIIVKDEMGQFLQGANVTKYSGGIRKIHVSNSIGEVIITDKEKIDSTTVQFAGFRTIVHNVIKPKTNFCEYQLDKYPIEELKYWYMIEEKMIYNKEVIKYGEYILRK
jgi:hypothetical protein